MLKTNWMSINRYVRKYNVSLCKAWVGTGRGCGLGVWSSLGGLLRRVKESLKISSVMDVNLKTEST